MENMTNREFMNLVIAMANEADSATIATKDGSKIIPVNPTDLAEYAKTEIEKMDARNAKRSSSESKAHIENMKLLPKVVEVLTDKENVLISDVATTLNVSTSKATALLKMLLADEKVTETEISVKGKGKRKAYTLV